MAVIFAASVGATGIQELGDKHGLLLAVPLAEVVAAESLIGVEAVVAVMGRVALKTTMLRSPRRSTELTPPISFAITATRNGPH